MLTGTIKLVGECPSTDAGSKFYRGQCSLPGTTEDGTAEGDVNERPGT